MTQHWLAIDVSHHPDHPVTHNEQIVVKIYFDEAPGDRSDQTSGVGVSADQYTVPSEHSHILRRARPITIWCAISEAEYNSASYDLFVWAEPYSVAAFSSDGVSDDLALGRLKLQKSHEDYRGGAPGPVTPTASVDPAKDKVILHRVKLANSVVQFLVDEINTNSQAPDVTENREDIERAREAVEHEQANPTPLPPAYYGPSIEDILQSILDREINQARRALGHRTHKNEDWQGVLQDVWFFGGGEWDHKPIIRPVWGALNRLGNAHEVYFYDGWSNIHFGYVGRKFGLSLRTILEGAGVAQGVDNSGGAGGSEDGDDPADAQAIRAGYALGGRQGVVTRQNILTILREHPGWVGRR